MSERKKLLTLANPPKRLNEMTDEELAAWADVLFDAMARNMNEQRSKDTP